MRTVLLIVIVLLLRTMKNIVDCGVDDDSCNVQYCDDDRCGCESCKH